MNESIFNVYPIPLYIEDINSNMNLSGRGDIYSTVVPLTSLPLLALGSTLLIRITNPSTSTKTLSLSKIIISHTNSILRLTITLYINGSFTGAGTIATPRNDNTGSGKTSNASVRYITNANVAGGKILSQITQTTTVNSNILNSEVFISPNTTFLITIFSPVTLIISDSIGATINWVEE